MPGSAIARSGADPDRDSQVAVHVACVSCDEDSVRAGSEDGRRLSCPARSSGLTSGAGRWVAVELRSHTHTQVVCRSRAVGQLTRPGAMTDSAQRPRLKTLEDKVHYIMERIEVGKMVMYNTDAKVEELAEKISELIETKSTGVWVCVCVCVCGCVGV